MIYNNFYYNEGNSGGCNYGSSPGYGGRSVSAYPFTTFPSDFTAGAGIIIN